MPGAIHERTIAVRGLTDLTRAFRLAEHDLGPDLRMALLSAAEPVRQDAERRAVAEIRNIGDPWSQMRIGVTQSSVYLAPQERGRRSRSNPSIRRPNLKGRLLDEAMGPALAANRDQVVDEADDALSDLFRAWARV
jgi:hypothetical protein